MTQGGFVFGCVAPPVLFVLSALFFYNGFVSDANIFEKNFVESLLWGTASLGTGVAFSYLFYINCKKTFGCKSESKQRIKGTK